MAPPQTIGKLHDDPSASGVILTSEPGEVARNPKSGPIGYGVSAKAVSEEMSVCVVSAGGAISAIKSSIRPQKLASPG
jgi:hypothetical protein